VQAFILCITTTVPATPSCLKQAGARALSKIQNSEELIARCLWNLEALRVAVQNQALCQRRALLGNALIEMTP